MDHLIPFRRPKIVQISKKRELCCLVDVAVLVVHKLKKKCYGPPIRPVEEQLKQRVIGKRYCIIRKIKSYKGSTSRVRLAVRLSNVSKGTRSFLPRAN